MSSPTSSTTTSAGASAAVVPPSASRAPAVVPPSGAPASPPPAQPPEEVKPKTIRQHLMGDAFRKEIAKALPRHLTADRFLRVALTALTTTPKLADCDQASFFNAMMKLSQLGLEPDGRRAHLIPFENRRRNCIECQLIIDYKGLAELALRSGMISTLHADVVRTGDLFEYSAGELKRHVPWFLRTDAEKPAKGGEMLAFYSLAKFRDGSYKAEVMSLDEVETIRRRSRAGNDGPWKTDFIEMGKKTSFRRMSKWLPLSAEIRDAFEADDDRVDLESMKRAQPGASLADALGDLPPMHSAPAIEDGGEGEGSGS